MGAFTQHTCRYTFNKNYNMYIYFLGCCTSVIHILALEDSSEPIYLWQKSIKSFLVLLRTEEVVCKGYGDDKVLR